MEDELEPDDEDEELDEGSVEDILVVEETVDVVLVLVFDKRAKPAIAPARTIMTTITITTTNLLIPSSILF